MPAPTPNRGYVYATQGDDNDLAFISQRLADAIDVDVQALFDAMAAQIPAGRIIRTAAQGIPNAAWTEIVGWSSETYRRGGLTYEAGHYLITQPGLYLFSAMVNWGGNSAGRRGVTPIVNSIAPSATGDQSVLPAGTAAPVNSTVSAPLLLAAGDMVTLGVYQDTGNPLNLSSCQMSLTWMGH